MNKVVTHGELFAGISGFGLGFEDAGIKTLWHVEIDPKCQSVLKRHYPDSLILGDITTVGAHNLPRVDVITFGSPCQDLSVAGKREGLSGERSGLFYEAVQVVRELRPRIIVWENVPGAISSNKGWDFKQVIEEIAGEEVPVPRLDKQGRIKWNTAGMVRTDSVDLAWRILDAQYFGVAQRRKRLFLVADFGSQCAAEILFECEGLRRDTPPSRETREGATAYATQLANTNSNEGTLDQNNSFGVTGTLDHKSCEVSESKLSVPIAFGGNNTSGEIDVATTCNAHGGTGRHDFESETFIAFQLTGDRDNPSVSTYNDVMPTIPANPMSDRQAAICWEMHHANEVLRTTDPDITPTLQARMGTGGNNVPMIGVRRLTPTECERLQGFPVGWTDGQADSARYRQLGNAVNVAVTRWLGQRIKTKILPNSFP